jgi:hypothetical protein
MAGTRKRMEELWGADVGDSYGISDVWGTLAGECEERAGLHFCGQGGTLVELVEPESGDAVPVEPGRRASSSSPTSTAKPPRSSASALGTSRSSSTPSAPAGARDSGSASSAGATICFVCAA